MAENEQARGRPSAPAGPCADFERRSIMKVTDQAVQDLIDLINLTPAGTREVLETLQDVLSILDTGDEGKAIRVAAQIKTIETNRGSIYSKVGFSSKYVQRLIRELDHYLDKRSVVEAALAKSCDLEGNNSTLKQMLPEVKAAFGNLDQRTKEIFGVFMELVTVSGNINVDFDNEILEVVTAKPLILRNEPKLAVIIQAYDLARPINHAM